MSYVILVRLDESWGTGPDLLPARMLRQGAKELAAPILRLTLLIFESGEWPDSWREHWVAPIYKKKAVFTPAKYRGVHLTAQLAKIIERLLLPLMLLHIQLWCLSGVNQFAHTKKRGARDALALLSMRWVDALDEGLKVLVYCSDVSGAFDKVSSVRLLEQLVAKGVHPKIIKLISYWLQPRNASVVVGRFRGRLKRVQDLSHPAPPLRRL